MGCNLHGVYREDPAVRAVTGMACGPKKKERGLRRISAKAGGAKALTTIA